MAAKNYYAVLGVRSDESAAGIRAAYHALARRLHPDVAGTGGTPRFQDINEAYAVLSDAGRRQVYDTELRGSEAPARRAPETMPEGFGPSGRYLTRQRVEIVLSPWEAVRGCRVPVRLAGEGREVWIEISPHAAGGALYAVRAGGTLLEILISISYEGA